MFQAVLRTNISLVTWFSKGLHTEEIPRGLKTGVGMTNAIGDTANGVGKLKSMNRS